MHSLGWSQQMGCSYPYFLLMRHTHLDSRNLQTGFGVVLSTSTLRSHNQRQVMIPCRFFAEALRSRPACRFIHTTLRPTTKEKAAASTIKDRPMILRPVVPEFEPSLDRKPLATLDGTIATQRRVSL